MAVATLLIVDDHPLFTDGFAHMVQGLRPDWTLLTAASAADALARLRVLRPDLTIIDIGLPDDDGFGLMRGVAELHPELPLVLISGRDDAAVRVRARASGAAGFIAKTSTPHAIVEMIETVLGGGRAFSDQDSAPICPNSPRDRRRSWP